VFLRGFQSRQDLIFWSEDVSFGRLLAYEAVVEVGGAGDVEAVELDALGIP
jgi:hypothetical protein